jgi:hypothetical protein
MIPLRIGTENILHVRFNPVEAKKSEIREWPMTLPLPQQRVWIFGVETKISTAKIDSVDPRQFS